MRSVTETHSAYIQVLIYRAFLLGKLINAINQFIHDSKYWGGIPVGVTIMLILKLTYFCVRIYWNSSKLNLKWIILLVYIEKKKLLLLNYLWKDKWLIFLTVSISLCLYQILIQHLQISVMETFNVFIILFLISMHNAFILWLILKIFLENLTWL